MYSCESQFNRINIRIDQSSADIISSKRSTPLSTNTAWNRLPIARFRSTAATLLSTPPLTAPITWPSSPTSSRIRAIASFTNEPISQSAFAPQIPNTKFLSITRPWGVCVTSGWNWMPYITLSSLAIAACSAFEVAPMSKKPSGRADNLSPWLIHTWKGSSNPSNRRIAVEWSFSVVTKTHHKYLKDPSPLSLQQDHTHDGYKKQHCLHSDERFLGDRSKCPGQEAASLRWKSTALQRHEEHLSHTHLMDLQKRSFPSSKSTTNHNLHILLRYHRMGIHKTREQFTVNIELYNSRNCKNNNLALDERSDGCTVIQSPE